MKVIEFNVSNGQTAVGGTPESIRIADVFKRLGSGAGQSIASGGTVWDPATGKRYRVLGGIITSDTAGEVVFTDSGAGTAFALAVKLLANTPQFIAFGNNGFIPVAADSNLIATLSGATLWGTLWGTEE